MNARVWLCAAVVALLGAGLFAQEDGGAAEPEDKVGDYFDNLDADKDGNLNAADMRKASEAELEEGATDLQKIQSFGRFLIDLVLADTNEDDLVSKSEFRKYIEDLYTEGVRLSLTARDWKVLEKDYLDPFIAENMKVYDANKDGILTKQEALAAEDTDEAEWAGLDANEDGKLEGDEYKHVYRGWLRDAYNLEESPSDINPEYISTAVKKDFKVIDTNGDGEATLVEYKAVRTKDNPAKQYWWGAFIRFLAMDSTGDQTVGLAEYFLFSREEPNSVKHKLYPSDKKAAMELIWSDLDTNKDASVVAEEYDAVPVENVAFDTLDADKDAKLTKDEFWSALIEMFSSSYEYVDKEKTDATTSATPTDGDKEFDKSAYALYTKVGRSWTIKYTTEMQGMDPIVQCVKTEVVEVTDKWAKIKATVLDKDQKPMGIPGSESKIPFNKPNAAGGEAPETTEETITVEAGEFECILITMKVGGQTTKTWTSKKYPGLVVKTTSEGMVNSSSELVAFVE